MDRSLNSVPLTVVVDAKDVFDKASSDTSSFGSQKSLAFTIAWMRTTLRRPNTRLRWTSTANMFADAGTKEMDLTHLRKILKDGSWCVQCSPDFVKQVAKGKRSSPSSLAALPGQALAASDPVFGHLLSLGEQRGWHAVEGMGINVAFDAKSFRTPEPRFSSAEYPFRTTFCRVQLPSGQAQWRVLSRDEPYTQLANQHGLLPERVPVLVTLFTATAFSS